ncbi:MAG: hypothetical protein KatS3mg051_1427 [Anaerolineae bacterium]|nr:MAG: hypothetical protein KatS3mg051_1427 [Anaerolineae bacterium]
MADVVIDFSEWQEHQRRLAQFAQREQLAVLREAAELAGAAFDEVVRSELPPPRRPLPQAPHWTARQRRWWWATMHAKAQGRSKALPGWKATYRIVEGRKTLVISGFYRRTGKLVQSLTYEVRQSGANTDVVYGTNRAYAAYVIDRDRQAQYHAGNWKTLQQFATEATARVRQAFIAGIERGVARRLGG